MQSSRSRLLRLALWAPFILACEGRARAACPLGLFETPRDKEAPVLNAIEGARNEVDVEVYELTDRDVERALIQARRAGRAVRVILNDRFPEGGNENRRAYDLLRASGVAVHYSPPYFVYTHEKAIVVDPGRSTEEALIMTLNLSPSYMGIPSRRWGMSLNFGVVDRCPAEVATIERLFDADWDDAGQGAVHLPAGTRLVVSPINARAQLMDQIEGARKSYHFFAQELEDPRIVAAIAAAARRGVDVKGLVPSNFPFNRRSGDLIKAAGGQVRFLDKPVYEHAKAAIADGASVYIGSINCSTNSIERNRELGIVAAQPDLSRSMEAEFARFWSEAVAW